ncbi:GspH/FimT family pseudopilin [Aquabacterium sp.]|uniref:GspH/FimT family pseudopilin n=1 Tax=Aquabacterium sp. TaxID=1872578 RepID=UPI002489E4D5|nr:GspH/FimT family pseudopilin [Aquabacterium sp.]MDI1259807.1 GspH/FimT family pseudopilin [Aquabacterium sp.]
MNIRGKGFTLVELMVTVAILVILLAIGVPSMQQFLESRRVISKADALTSGMRFARSEALKRGQTIRMCITTTADTITPTCAAAASRDWAVGWMIYADADNDGNLDNTEQILRIQQAFNGGGALTGDRNPVSFTADGFALGSNTSILVASSQASDLNIQRCVFLSGQGRTRTDKVPANGQC